MARRLNYTGRKKITRQDVSIRVHRNGQGLIFDADLTRIGEYKLDPQARVYVEAYRSASTAWHRWDFGRVGIISAPSVEQRSLDRFGGADGLLFRVKVSADGESLGKLLAEADAIRPLLPDDLDSHGVSLIDPVSGPIGHEPWRVQFPDSGKPLLVINERTPGWKELVMEPRFRAIVAPAAMRIVLTRILIIERGAVIDDEDESKWSNRWIRFAESLPGVSEYPTPEEEQGLLHNQGELEDWIDAAVSAFSARSGLFDRFLEIRQHEVGQ